MNTHTILNFKIDKKLKAEAKKVAQELGLPLGTVMNVFLKQFVRDRSIFLSADEYRPTPYLVSLIEEAEAEMSAGNIKTFTSVEACIADLKK